MGKEKPNPTLGDNLAKWQRNNNNLYAVLFLATNGGVPTAVSYTHLTLPTKRIV